MSRGIPEKEAEALLIQAFVGEAIEEIAHEGIREALMFARARMAGEREAEHAPGGQQRRLRRRQDPRGFSGAGDAGLWQAAGLSRQRRLGAEAEGRCSTASRRPIPTQYANVHRGLHYLANEATEAYEGARETVRRFLNAERKEEIIFTRNATEAINLVAYTFGTRAHQGRATRSCSRSWSTIPTSCPGISCASARAR